MKIRDPNPTKLESQTPNLRKIRSPKPRTLAKSETRNPDPREIPSGAVVGTAGVGNVGTWHAASCLSVMQAATANAVLCTGKWLQSRLPEPEQPGWSSYIISSGL